MKVFNYYIIVHLSKTFLGQQLHQGRTMKKPTFQETSVPSSSWGSMMKRAQVVLGTLVYFLFHHPTWLLARERFIEFTHHKSFRLFILQLLGACYFQERMFVSITDLITLSSLLAISPAVREAAALLAHGDKREIAVLNVRNAQFITLVYLQLGIHVIQMFYVLELLNIIFIQKPYSQIERIPI